jgi:purine-binding chemotaxis protein CheW
MNTSTIPTRVQGPSSGGGTTTSYVTFLLAGEIYGVPAAAVREVIMWAPVTRIPNAGASVKGVINLRGEIVPVLDSRTRLGLAPIEPTDRTCIVVVHVRNGSRQLAAGLIVDTALEVARLISAEISGGDGRLAGDLVTGVARTKAGLVMLLDVDRLVREELDDQVGRL